MTRSSTARARCSARSPGAATTPWRRCAPTSPTCGATPASSCSSWAASSPSPSEWADSRSLDWWLLDHAAHYRVHNLVKELNRIYREYHAMWALDAQAAGFEWLDVNDNTGNLFSYLRFADEERQRASGRRRRRSTSAARQGVGPGRRAPARRVAGHPRHERLRRVRHPEPGRRVLDGRGHPVAQPAVVGHRAGRRAVGALPRPGRPRGGRAGAAHVEEIIEAAAASASRSSPPSPGAGARPSPPTSSGRPRPDRPGAGRTPVPRPSRRSGERRRARSPCLRVRTGRRPGPGTGTRSGASGAVPRVPGDVRGRGQMKSSWAPSVISMKSLAEMMPSTPS